MAVGIGVETDLGVFVTRDASVVAIASSIGTLGVAAVLFGKEQDVKVNNKNRIKVYFMRGLYSFSEQINFVGVLRVKE